jgi:hypothetical protein
MTRRQTAASARTGVAVGRDILIALAIKLSLLMALYCCFFSESHRPKADPQTTALALLDHSTVNP